MKTKGAVAHFVIYLVFIMMLVVIGVSKLETFAGWGWLRNVNGLLTLIIFFYFYKAMRSFYRQRRIKTIWKNWLISISITVLIFHLFTVFLVMSFFQV